MSLAIDIALILIVAYMAWRGFRNGFIRAVLGILAILAAIYGANLVAKTYSGEFTGMLKPFVGGIIGKAVSNAMDGSDAPAAEGEDSAPEDNAAPNVFDISFEALQAIGVSDEAAGLLADKVGGEIESVGQQMTATLTEKLCAALAYILVFGITFLVIAILFAIIGNLLNLVYILPGIETADRLIGLVLGLLKGGLIVFAIAMILRYMGLISPEVIDKTTLLKFLTDVNPLADILGI